MGETHQQATTSSRLGMRSEGGKIVEVEGGHIVRSTGRKDRHSKVCTAKGTRDRRVRLSAHTAIQFYDVQDRLGYDRPSKAVDWLINKAKSAIDELAELPAWNPITTTSSPLNPNAHHHQQQQQMNAAPSSSRSRATSQVGSGGRISELHEQLGENPSNGGGSGFLPTSLDTDIADTMKCFFPETTTSSLSSIQFQSYPPDLLSRTSTSSSSQNQDLRLSLQSFQDPMLLHQHHHHQAQTHHHHNEHALFSGTTTPLGFDGVIAWNGGSADTGNSGHGGGGGGFIFNTPSPSPSPVPLFGQSQYLSQRGPLQSSNNPSIRAWVDHPSITTATLTDHHLRYLPPTIHQSSISGIGFASGGFSGFRIPARIQGEEEHDGVSDMPSSASSDSRH